MLISHQRLKTLRPRQERHPWSSPTSAQVSQSTTAQNSFTGKHHSGYSPKKTELPAASNYAAGCTNPSNMTPSTTPEVTWRQTTPLQATTPAQSSSRSSPFLSHDRRFCTTTRWDQQGQTPWLQRTRSGHARPTQTLVLISEVHSKGLSTRTPTVQWSVSVLKRKPYKRGDILHLSPMHMCPKVHISIHKASTQHAIQCILPNAITHTF